MRFLNIIFLLILLSIGYIILINLLVIIISKLSKKINYDGEIIVSITEEGKKLFSLELTGDVDDLDKKKLVKFKVINSDLLVEE